MHSSLLDLFSCRKLELFSCRKQVRNQLNWMLHALLTQHKGSALAFDWLPFDWLPFDGLRLAAHSGCPPPARRSHAAFRLRPGWPAGRTPRSRPHRPPLSLAAEGRRMNFAICLLSILLVPLATAGLALIHQGLGRSRSAAHSMLATLCALAVTAIVFVLIGFS